VVTTDTAMAHLAGALGARTWVLLQKVPDWRWLLDRPDSPWYPTMRLFRQQTAGDWDGVVAELAQALRENWPMSFPATGDRASQEQAAAVTAAVKASVKTAVQGSVSKAQSTKIPEAGPQTAPEREVLKLDPDGFNEARQCRRGPMVWPRNDIYIGACLREYGDFSLGETELFRKLVRPGDWVVEVGSNVGAHTVELSATVGPRGRVLAFEPQRLIFQTLCANLALTQCANVWAHWMALGAEEGVLSVPHLDPAARNNFGGLSLGRAHATGDPVALRTLDSFELPSCRLLKADVEGMEVEVLKGSLATINRLRPILYLENDRQQRSAELIDLVMGLEYDLFWHTPPMFDPRNHAGEQHNHFPGIVSVNVLCMPCGQSPPLAGLRPIRSPDDSWKRVSVKPA
jgi:FkbM family methyltransferase